jgi:hypothetical protein
MKLRYHCRNMKGSAEFGDKVVRIGLPNGKEFTLEYDRVTGGLIVNKVVPFDDTNILIKPQVTNEIIIL